MTLSTPDAGILIVNTFPAKLGECLGASEKSLISKLGGEFKVRAISALGDLSGPVPEQGIILNGSPYSLLDSHAWTDSYKEFAKEMMRRKKIILGICFGHQGLAEMNGGTIGNVDQPHFGPQEVELTEHGMKHPLFNDLPKKISLPGSHFNHVASFGDDRNKTLARTTNSPHYAIDINTEEGGNVWGVQFHPEMDGERLATVIELKKDKIPDWKKKKAEAKKLQFGNIGGKIISNYGLAVLRAKLR